MKIQSSLPFQRDLSSHNQIEGRVKDLSRKTLNPNSYGDTKLQAVCADFESIL